MKIPKFDKWTRGIDEDDSLPRAAAKSLGPRLKALRYLLRLAADRERGCPDAVHELRVHTRRTTAALQLYEKWIPPKEARWWTRQLKRIRKAAGNARDLDVMIERYACDGDDPDRKRLLDHVHRQRVLAQTPLVATHERFLCTGKLERRTARILKGVKNRARSAPGNPRFGDWARCQAGKSLEIFLQSVPIDPHNVSQLHQFRICGKQLRYTMELLAPAFPSEFRKGLYHGIVALQDRLGEINDHAVAIAHLKEWAQAAEDQMLRRILESQVSKEQLELSAAASDFAVSYSDQRVREFEEGFRRVLQGGK